LIPRRFNVSKRNGSEITQLSDANWGGQKAKWLFYWPRSRRRMVVCSCQAVFKNLFSHSTTVWLKCSWIVI